MCKLIIQSSIDIART